jgi:hypothetical protein
MCRRSIRLRLQLAQGSARNVSSASVYLDGLWCDLILGILKVWIVDFGPVVLAIQIFDFCYSFEVL